MAGLVHGGLVDLSLEQFVVLSQLDHLLLLVGQPVQQCLVVLLEGLDELLLDLVLTHLGLHLLNDLLLLALVDARLLFHEVHLLPQGLHLHHPLVFLLRHALDLLRLLNQELAVLHILSQVLLLVLLEF